MCGIAGVFAYGQTAPQPDPQELRRVRDYMRARGPDGEGEWFSPNARVGLAHRRLAIIDLSAAGAQPMQLGNGRLTITFNGEIYNYRLLRAELERDGVVFASDSDTEVILHLYERYGAATLTKLRGMFALAIWDARDESLFLARDPFGIKPLYYADNGNTIRFASQVKALLTADVDRSPEPAGHAGFFIWGSVPEPWTLYRGIRALPAGTSMTVRQCGASAPMVYASVHDALRRAARQPPICTRDEAKEAVAKALRDSVAAHHVADVPVGVFLSAGLDSTLLAHLEPEPRHDSMTVTLGFEEFRNTLEDEVPLAEEVARGLGAWHSTVMVSRNDFMHERERLFAAMDQPSIDGVNSWFVARAASQMGLKVALSGVGGDELFASYSSFRDIPRILKTMKRFSWLARIGKPLRRLSAPIVGRLTSPKYASLAEYGASCGGAYLLRRALYLPWELKDDFSPVELSRGVEALESIDSVSAACLDNPSARLSVSALETSWYMKNQLLRDTDWASMAHSLEVRTPFVDWQLLNEIAPYLSVHPDISKAEHFAATAPKISSAILQKPKTGFVVPLRDWLMAGESRTIGARGLRGWSHHVYQMYAP